MEKESYSLLRWVEDKNERLELPGGEAGSKQREKGNCHGNRRIDQKVTTLATIFKGVSKTKERQHAVLKRVFIYKERSTSDFSHSTGEQSPLPCLTFYHQGSGCPAGAIAPTLPTPVVCKGPPYLQVYSCRPDSIPAKAAWHSSGHRGQGWACDGMNLYLVHLL